MSHELLYTSAPKGLKPGSRGFCTVVCTQGMPPSLITALESLSAYRPVYPAGDRNAVSNPVVWSHVKMNAGGRAYHILSRIADFGLDFSQRGNKLAHHIALETSEQVACGPAAVLESPGFMDTTWNGQPRLLPAGRPLRSVSRLPSVCNAWRTLAGDAGWAGEVAETFLQTPDRPVYIEFAPGMKLLPLLAEAIALLPADRRWDVTLSTFFTSLPPGVTCGWKCVLSGSPEAEQARSISRALYINLCEPVRAATGGGLVEAARSGRSAAPRRTPQFAAADNDWTDDALAAVLELQPIDANDADAPVFRGSGQPVQSSEHEAAPSEAEYSVSPRPPTPPPPPPVAGRRRRTVADVNVAEAALRSKRFRWIVGSLVCVVVALGLGAFAIPPSREWVLKQIGRPKKSDNVVVLGAKQGAAPPDGSQLPLRSANADTGANRESMHENTASADASEPNDELTKESDSRDAETSTTAAGSDKSDGDETANSKPQAANANQTSPSQPIRRSPRVGADTLEAIAENNDNGYELYAFNVQSAIDADKTLQVPVRDAKSSKWKLYAPAGRFDVSVKSSGLDNSKFRVTTKDALGTGWQPVLTIEKSEEAGNFIFRFRDSSSGSEVASWCLLAVEETGQPVRLFALQELSRKLDENEQFSGFKFQLKQGFDDKHAITSNSKLRVASVEIWLPPSQTPYRFETVADSGGKYLQCPELDTLATEIMSIEYSIPLEVTETKGDLSLTFARAGQPAPGILLDKGFYETGMEKRLEKIETGIPSDANSRRNFNRDKLKKEFKAAPKERQSLIQFKKDLGEEIKNLNSEANPGKIELVDSLRTTLKELEILEGACDKFATLKKNLGTARIREVLLRYEFVPSVLNAEKDAQVLRTLPVEIKFEQRSQ